MNAPARIPRMPKREHYVPMVKGFLPGCDGEELQLRCSLLLLRDSATGSKRQCSDEAFPLLETVERLAREYAFASRPVERLQELRYELLRLTTCASGLEQFAFRLAHPEHGGTDASGG